MVIGSGATAVTLIPSMAGTAGHITMLQRTPTYIISQPGHDKLADLTRRLLPSRLADRLTRGRYLAQHIGFYEFCQRFPGAARSVLRRGLEKQLPDDVPVDEHFRPPYDPWDQRLCLVPDGDLFKAIGDGSAEVVTDRIRTFTETGIELESGRVLEADVVVTATGLNVQVFGGASLSVDGVELEPSKTLAYRAMMLSGVPNFAFSIGYTNASWTLKADLVSEFVCRLLDHMGRTGTRIVTPVRDESVQEVPLMDFEAGYIKRVVDSLPRQGTVEPWAMKQNYVYDVRTIRRAPLDDGVLSFR